MRLLRILKKFHFRKRHFFRPKLTKKTLIFYVTGIALAAVGISYFLIRGNEAAAWFDDSFRYRKSIAITNSNGVDLTDFQTSFTLDTATLITDGKMKSDCSDVRFVTREMTEITNYWIEESGVGACNTSTTKMWVKIPSLIRGGIDIFVYYGNTNAGSSLSNGTNTFDFFDDFSSGSVDTSKWTSTDIPAVSSQILNLNATSSIEGIRSNSTFCDASPGNGDSCVMGFRGSQSSTATSAMAGFSNQTTFSYTPPSDVLTRTAVPNSTAVKIDDAGDPGAMSGSGRQVVRTSDGTLYAAINDGVYLSLWKSVDGSQWVEQDISNRPFTGYSTVPIALVIDTSDVIHIGYIFVEGSDSLYYVSFDTVTNTYGAIAGIRGDISDWFFSIALDSNNKIHAVYDYFGLRYKNNTGGGWNSEVLIESGNQNYADITINEDNIPEISYINMTDADLTAAVGNQNNATTFTLFDVDTSVIPMEPLRTEIIVSEAGDTYIGYVEFGGAPDTDRVNLAKHNDADAWSTWQVYSLSAGSEFNPSFAVIGSTVYSIYHRNSNIILNKFSGTAWLGETTLTSNQYQNFKARWSLNNNNFGAKVLDFLYSDGTDIYYDSFLLPIDDGSDFGALPGGGRQLVRTSDGTLYAAVNDGGSCEIWKYSATTGWAEQDSTNNPSCSGGLSIATDSTNNIQMTYINGSSALDYVAFSTSTDSFGSVDVGILSSPLDTSISIDSNDKPHLVAVIVSGPNTALRYLQKVSGSWSTVAVAAGSGISSPDITINEDNVAELAYKNLTTLYGALGNQNAATSFTIQSLDTSVIETSQIQSIAIDSSGNTWVAYIDENGATDYVTLIKHNDADPWSTWQTPVTNSNAGSEPSLAIINNKLYVLYTDENNDIVYDIYNGSTWAGETLLFNQNYFPGNTGNLQDVKARWSFNHFNSPTTLDYIFSNGTDAFWDTATIGSSNPTYSFNSDDSSAILFDSTTGGNHETENANAGTTETGTVAVAENTSYHNYEISLAASGSTFNVDGTTGTLTTQIVNSAQYLRFEATDTTNTLNVDWVYVRKLGDTTTTVGVEELQKVPIMYLSLNEGSGTTAYDSTVFGNDGTVSGATWTPDDQCHSGKCLQFDGVDDFLSIGTTLNDSKTITFWVRPTTNSQSILELNSTTNITSSNGTLSATGFTSPTIYVNGRVSSTISANEWNHVSVTTNTAINANQIRFGRVSASYLNGFMDELKMYPYALTAAEVRKDMQGGGIVGSSVRFANENQSFLSDGLVGYWKMDETTGNATDSSGNSLTLTNNGTATYVAGKYGNGTEYVPASTQYFSTVTTVSGVKTISLWVNPDSTSNYYWDLNGSVYLTSSSGTLGVAGTTTETIYVNGVATTTISADTWSMVTVVLTDAVDATALAIGKQSTNYFDGSIDEVRIYNRALSASEVQALYNFAPGPVAYWDFNENTGTSTYDKSGNGNLGTLTNGPTWNKGKFGSAVKFDGTDDFIQVADSSSLDITGAITTEAWVKGVVGQSNSTSSGPNSPGTMADDATIGVVPWLWPERAMMSDALYAAANKGSGVSHYLNATNFGFSVPSGATISGILVEIRKRGERNSALDYAVDDEVKIVKSNGSIGTINKADTVTHWSTAWTYVSHGGSGDLWGETWTENDINSSNFGVVLSATGDGSEFGCYAYIDHIRITVYYIDSATGEILSKTSSAYSLSVDDSNGITGAINTSNSVTATLADSNWHHVVQTYDGTTQKLFIDGKLVDSGALTGAIATNSNVLKIGENVSGIIDDVKIYNYARTPAQIVEDMNAGHPAPGSPVGSALAHYKFDEGYGTTVNNWGNGGSSLNGTLGTGSSAPAWTNDGKFGKALSFDGSNDYVNIPWSTDLPIASLSMWMKSDSTFVSTAIFFEGDGTAAASSPSFEGTSTLMRFYVANGCLLSTAYTEGQWTHFVGTWDGVNNYLYKNGIQAGVGACTAAETNFSKFVLGSRSGVLAGDVTMDEVKIYNLALTADQVKAEYNAGKSQMLGSLSTGVGGTTPSWSASREYCVPGDTATCNAPVAEWKMDEGTGTAANDTSGNANTGTLGAGSSAPSWTKGKLGNGLNFDGSNDYVLGPANDLLTGLAGFTISSWANVNDTSNIRHIYTESDQSSGSWLRLSINTDDKVSFMIYTSSAQEAISTDTISLGWHHITGTFDTTNGMKLFVDGKLVATNINISNPSRVTGSVIGAQYAYLGGGSFNGFMNGHIDQVRIYNYARTPAQIAWEYNRGAPVAWYKFDECQGTTVNDWAPNANGGFNGNNGTITIGASGSNTSVGTCAGAAGQAWYDGATGKIKSSLEFDGTDDYVNMSNGAALDIAGGNQYTLAAWMYRTSSGIQYVIDKQQGTFGGYYIYLNASEFCAGVPNGSGWNEGCSVGASLALNTWTHILVSYNGVNQRFYKDGNLLNSPAQTATLLNSTSNLNIGRHNSGGYFFTGKIDDVRIYNYALTGAQVKDVYNNGAVSFK